MRILVTGAGGFVGRHVLSDLVGAGHSVVACSHRAFENDLPFESKIFDLRDRETVATVIDETRPEGIVHLAAQASVRLSWEDPAETYSSNVTGTVNLLDAARRVGSRVLLVGSAQVYGEPSHGRTLKESDEIHPSSPYALTKAAQELIGSIYFAQTGLATIMSRSFNHTGPGQSTEYAVGHFCAQIVDAERGGASVQLEVGNLEPVRDFLDVRDVAKAYRLLLEHGEVGGIYNVCSGEGTRVGDILKILIDHAEVASSIEVIESKDHRAGDPLALVGDNAKIRSATGWEPVIPLDQSLLDTLNWYRGKQTQ